MRWLLGSAALLAAVWAAVPGEAGRNRPLPELAFVQERLDCTQVRVMRSDGTRVRRVVPCSFGVQSPDWAPDGSELVFGTSGQLYTVGADGRGRHEFLSLRGYASDPAWSPDGRLLAYASGRSLLIVNVEDGGVRRIAGAQLEVWGPQWSPDGERIVYFGGGVMEEDLDLFVVVVSTMRVTRLTRSVGNEVYPAWSPDGKLIAYIQRAGGMLGALVTVRPDGRGRRILLRDQVYSQPDWSPDGRRLAFVRDEERRAEIYTVSRNGSDLRRVTRNRFADSEPDWRPSQP